ncbi:MAG: hypothetical protein J5600_03970, partial [Desulfovibrio sp.]|nr:hypothetical protein [Desulfovibrio sp.]
MRFFTNLMAGAATLLLSLTFAGNAPAAPQAEAISLPENLVAYDGGSRYRRPPPPRDYYRRPPPPRHAYHRPPPPPRYYHRPPPPRHAY